MLKSIKCYSVAALFFVANISAGFAYNSGVSVKDVSVSDTTSVGERIVMPDCDAQVTMCTVVLPKDANTGWHYHKNLVFAFVEKGTLRVETEEGYTDFKAGENVFEMQNKIHVGKNVGKGKVVLKVVYVGCKGVENSIMVDAIIKRQQAQK